MRSRVIVAAAILVILAIAATTAYVVLFSKPANATATATATVFIGSAQVERNGSTTFATLHSGDQLGGGDTVRTGASSKAAINFPDGSITRLDGSTELKVKAITRDTSGNYQTLIDQTAGKTWSKVQQLVGGARFQVSAPNGSTAEVRGTEFAVIIETAPDGTVIVRIDTYSGSLNVSANGFPAIHVDQGQSTTIGSRAPPSPVVPIPAADSNDSFTVFNQTLDVTPGAPIGFDTDVLNEGDTSPVATAPAANGRDDLNFTLGWPGSTFEIIVVSSNGTELARQSSPTPPVTVSVLHAPTGTGYRVHDIQSKPKETFWVIVTHKTDKGPTPTPPAGSPTPSPSASPIASPTSSPTPGPTPTPSATPSPSPNPVPLPSPSPSPSPSPTPTSTLPSPYPYPYPTPSPSPSPTPTPTPTPTPLPSPSPSPTPSPTPSATPTPSPSPSPAAQVSRVVLVASPTTILADNTATSLIVAQALGITGQPIAAPSAITVTLSSSNTACCTLVTGTTTIAAGAMDSSASPGKVQSTTTSGSSSIGGTATDGLNVYPVTAVTVTTTSNSITLPAQVLVAPSAAVSFSITLSPAAPIGGVTVNLTTLNAGITTVTGSVAFAAGQSAGTATLTGVANGQTTLAASATGYAATSTLAVVKVITIGFTPNSYVSLPATRTDSSEAVLLSAAAPVNLQVNLVSNNLAFATVTSSVIVPAGQLTSPNFTVTGVAQGNTTITASATGATSGNLNVYVGAVPAISLSGESPLGAGLYRNFSLSLNTPAGAGGQVVNLLSSDPTKLTVPASVTVPAGYSYANYPATGVAPTSTTPVTITASAAGWTTGTTTDTVVTPTFFFSGVPASETTLNGAYNFNLLSNTPGCGYYCDYFTGSTSITLTVNGTPSGIVTVTTPVTPSAGTYYVAATVSAPTTGGSYTITASATGFTNATSATTTVIQPSITLQSNSAIGAGLYRNFNLSLSNPAPLGGLVINLTSSDTTLLTVPASVTVPAGISSANYTATGVAPTSTTPVTITATATNWTTGTTTEAVVTPTFYISGVPSSETTLAAAYNFNVFSYTPGCGYYCDYFTGSTAITLTVNGSPSGIVTVTSPVTPGAGTWYVAATVSSPTVGGSYTITASATGFTSATSATTTVIQPSITLSGNSPIGAGLYRNFNLSLSNAAPGGGLVVNLTSSNTSQLTVPSSVTVPAGSYGTSYQASGIAPTSTTPVTITATATNWTTGTTTEAVVTPTFFISGVPSSETTLAVAYNFNVFSDTPGCGYYCDYFTGSTAITLTVIGSPSGIVTVTSPVTPGAGTYYVGATVSAPTAGGSYTITASAPGFTSATSSTTTVTQPSITLGTNSAIGAGLYRPFSLSLSNPAPTGGLVVNLASTDPTILTVPASVTVPAGSYSTSYQANGIKPGTVSISASAPLWAGSTTNETVATPTFYISSVPSSETTLAAAYNFNVFSYTPGCGYYCDYFTGSTAIMLTVNGSPSGIVTVTSPVTPGAGTYYVGATVSAPTAVGTYTITASATGFTGATSATTTVTQPFITVNTANPLGAGMYRTNGFSISLSNPAPSGGLVVSLSSSNTGVATVPATVTVAATATYAYYTMTGVSAGTTVVTASAGGWTSGTQTMTVNTPTFGFNNVITNRTTASAADVVSVFATNSGCYQCDLMSSPVTVTVSVASTTSGIATVSPTSVTIAAGFNQSGTFSISTPTTSGTYNIVAAGSGFTNGQSASVTVS